MSCSDEGAWLRDVKLRGMLMSRQGSNDSIENGGPTEEGGALVDLAQPPESNFLSRARDNTVLALPLFCAFTLINAMLAEFSPELAHDAHPLLASALPMLLTIGVYTSRTVYFLPKEMREDKSIPYLAFQKGFTAVVFLYLVKGILDTYNPDHKFDDNVWYATVAWAVKVAGVHAASKCNLLPAVCELLNEPVDRSTSAMIAEAAVPFGFQALFILLVKHLGEAQLVTVTGILSAVFIAVGALDVESLLKTGIEAGVNGISTLFGGRFDVSSHASAEEVPYTPLSGGV